MFDIGNKHYEFFDMLNQHAKYFNQGSKIMYDVMINYDTAQTKMEEIKTVEKQADLVTAETVQKLNQVFITPIDREDIFALSYGLDDGVDNIIFMVVLNELSCMKQVNQKQTALQNCLNF